MLDGEVDWQCFEYCYRGFREPKGTGDDKESFTGGHSGASGNTSCDEERVSHSLAQEQSSCRP